MNCRATCFLKPDSSLANENGKPQNESSTQIGLICLSVMLANKVTRPHHHLLSLALAAPVRQKFSLLRLFSALCREATLQQFRIFRFLDIYNRIVVLPAFCWWKDKRGNDKNKWREARKTMRQVKLRETQLDRHDYTPIKRRIYTTIQGWMDGLTGQWPETGIAENALCAIF